MHITIFALFWMMTKQISCVLIRENDSDDDKVTWELPTENDRKVDIIFRDVATSENSNFFSDQAKIQDLKIFFSDSQTMFATTTFEPEATVPATTPASTTQEFVEENDEFEWLSFDLSIYRANVFGSDKKHRRGHWRPEEP